MDSDGQPFINLKDASNQPSEDPSVLTYQEPESGDISSVGLRFTRRNISTFKSARAMY